MRIGLESKKLVECVNNQTSKDPGLMALLRPLVLLLLLNDIQLSAQLYESKSSEESLFLFPLQGQQEDWKQVSRFRGQKVRHLHQAHSWGSKDIGEINEAKDHQTLSKDTWHVYNLHKRCVRERNSGTTVRESHNHVYSPHGGTRVCKSDN